MANIQSINNNPIVAEGSVQAFETVADMQASEVLQAGMIAHTNGFHTSGDGGAAYYNISASGTANGMDVLALQGGLFATLVVTEHYVTPEQFGAYGDGTHDDASAVQGSIDYATANGCDAQFSTGMTYLVSAGITVGNVNLRMLSPVKYLGSGAAVTVGSQGSNTYRNSYELWAIGANPYTSGSIGAQMVNCTNCEVYIHNITNFEQGFVGQGYNAGFGYNNVQVNLINNCMTAIALRSDGTNGWANENRFEGGRLFVDSNMAFKNQWTGILIDSDHAYNANSNTFEKLSIEGAAICAHIVYGSFNQFENIRTEAATLAFKDENNSNWNKFYVTYGTTDAETVGAMDVIDGYQYGKYIINKLVYDTGYLPEKSFSNANYLFCGKELSYMNANGVLSQPYRATKHNDHLDITSRNIGVMLDTSIAKRFVFSSTSYNGASWRMFLVGYDSDGNYIASGVKSNVNRPLTVSTGAISGVTAWIVGSNSNVDTYFELPDNCVRAFVGIISTTATCGFKIYSDSSSGAIIGNQVANGLTAIPTCEGKAGDFCPSSAADSTLGWLYNGTSWVAIS